MKNLAIITGVLAFIFFVATPFLPVNQTQSSFSWPQNETLNSVNAPLISVAPEEFAATVPLEAAEMLNEGQSMMLGTVPADSPEATDRGLFVRYAEETGLDVSSISEVLFHLPPEDLEALPPDSVLQIETTGDGTRVSVPGTSHEQSSEEDLRPQVTGVYTEIENTPENYQALTEAGLSADVEINSRFTSTPSTIKLIAMWGGVFFALVSLWALWKMDRHDGHKIRFAQRWKQFKPLDGIVVAILGFWHVFGANTSDDGFILNMARVSENAGYMANYYRWYGVPESPFGSPYYDLLALLTQVTAASVWVRLPALISGIAIWLILSREILPRFGPLIDGRRVAHWTAAFTFLAFWLPFNNGTRPEPIIALGALLAWALFERAIAQQRLFPAAVGTVVAAFTLTAGPTGLIAVGAFLVALPYLARILVRRLRYFRGPKWYSSLAMVLPFLGVGTAVLVPVFADQTLAAVLESTRVRSAVGPAMDWYAEYVRYSTLFQQTVDGSLTRRFAMLVLFASLGLIIYSLFRHGRVLGAAKPPTMRLLMIIAFSMLFLMFTPTKWTHHFGIYAGIAAAAAALAAVVISQIVLRSPRARTFTVSVVLFILAITFAGWNGWWYVSSFGVPWWDKIPQIKGIEFSTIFLILALLVMGIGVVQSFVHDYRKRKAEEAGTLAEFDERNRQRAARFGRLTSAPIAVVSILVVTFSLLSFGKAFIDQYPAYSVGLGNVRALGGNAGGLANDAMVETNTNESFLEPVGDVALGDSLESEEIYGFSPNNMPGFIARDSTEAASVGAVGGTGGENEDSGTVAGATGDEGTTNTEDSGSATGSGDEQAEGATSESDPDATTESAAESSSTSTDISGGTRDISGVNGSTAHLPFNIDYSTVPVVGSYFADDQYAAEVTTSWYELPEATETAPLVVVSAAGRIAHHDQNGVQQPGETLMLEYGQRQPDGSVERMGEQEMMDIGPTPTWRNLRFPIEDLPEEADAVRIVAEDMSLAPEDWIAFTPPRVPELEQLTERVSPETPTLLDWSVGLQFPTLRTFDHYAGVTEIPEYRISPDHPGKSALTGFMDFLGGGSMATTEAVNSSYQVPSYTKDDWHRDWGSVESYQLRTNSQGEAPDDADIDTEEIQRSGTWHESDMKIRSVE